MNSKIVQEKETKLPLNCHQITEDDIDVFRKRVGFEDKEPMSVEECRQMLNERLGDVSLSDMLIEMRREARY